VQTFKISAEELKHTLGIKTNLNEVNPRYKHYECTTFFVFYLVNKTEGLFGVFIQSKYSFSLVYNQFYFISDTLNQLIANNL
jgi:hypothetical protein